MPTSALDRALTFLGSEQLPSGAFLSTSTPAHNPALANRTYTTTFFTSLILDALCDVSNERAERIKAKAAAYLSTQRSPHWTFNYWDRTSPEARIHPYPDDLDDTACALAALTRSQPGINTSQMLAHLTRVLTNQEVEAGGPYRTWIVTKNGPAVWQDIDCIVNSNIAYLLSLHSVELPALTRLAEERLKHRHYNSPYYPTVYPGLYFLSRWYQGAYCKEVADQIMAQRYPDGSWGSPLATALACSSLTNLNKTDVSSLESSIHQLEQLLANKQWRVEAFCIDPAIDGQTYYAGAATLTAALCLQAVSLYRGQRKASPPASGPKNQPRQEGFSRSVLRETHARIASPSPLNNQLVMHLDRIGQQREVSLTPYWFWQSLGNNQKKIPKKLVIQAGVLSLFGWTAYSLFDMLLDTNGPPEDIPIATAALRHALDLCDSLAPTPVWKSYCRSLFARMDAANYTETTQWRTTVTGGLLTVRIPLPVTLANADLIADRSIGHALSCLTLLGQLGYSPQNAATRHLEIFFHHAIIAKQLNDDAHDWEEDLRNGRITPLVGTLLESLAVQETVSLSTLIPQARTRFWNETIINTCQLIEMHIQAARKALTKVTVIEAPDQLEPLLTPAAEAAATAQTERERMLIFLKTYTS